MFINGKQLQIHSVNSSKIHSVNSSKTHSVNSSKYTVYQNTLYQK